MSETTYIVEVPGYGKRSARSDRGARRTMGRLMAAAPVGTRGTIHTYGRTLVLRAEATSLGWTEVAK